MIVLDLDDGFPGVHDPEIHDCVHFYRDVVPGDDVLGGDVVDDGPEGHPHHPVDDRDQEEEPRPVVLGPEAPQPEHDATLVLRQDLDRVDEQEQEDQEGNQEPDRELETEEAAHAFPPTTGAALGSTTTRMPSTRTTLTKAP